MKSHVQVVVIGGGVVGASVLYHLARAGWTDVVLIERAKMGGDCLNYGCVPSKALIAAAKAAQAKDPVTPPTPAGGASTNGAGAHANSEAPKAEAKSTQ